MFQDIFPTHKTNVVIVRLEEYAATLTDERSNQDGTRTKDWEGFRTPGCMSMTGQVPSTTTFAVL